MDALMTFLDFAFQSFIHFLGVSLLFAGAVNGIVEIIHALRSPRPAPPCACDQSHGTRDATGPESRSTGMSDGG